jgi:hypothetical protein
MRTSSLLLSLCLLACGSGSDAVVDLARTDGFLSIVDFSKAHEESDYFVTETDADSPFGEVTRVEPGLTWLYAEREVRVPQGEWKLDWRLAIPTGRSLDALLRVQPEPGCGEEVSLRVNAEGLGADVWMLIPEEAFRFSVPKTCVVKISLLDEESVKSGWGLDWARIVPAD